MHSTVSPLSATRSLNVRTLGAQTRVSIDGKMLSTIGWPANVVRDLAEVGAGERERRSRLADRRGGRRRCGWGCRERLSQPCAVVAQAWTAVRRTHWAAPRRRLRTLTSTTRSTETIDDPPLVALYPAEEVDELVPRRPSPATRSTPGGQRCRSPADAEADGPVRRIPVSTATMLLPTKNGITTISALSSPRW